MWLLITLSDVEMYGMWIFYGICFKSNFGSCMQWLDSNLQHTCGDAVLSNCKYVLFKALMFNLNNIHPSIFVELDLTCAEF